jgi:hypothetical protein
MSSDEEESRPVTSGAAESLTTTSVPAPVDRLWFSWVRD